MALSKNSHQDLDSACKNRLFVGLMKLPHLVAGLCASGFVFFGAGLPKALAVNFGFDDIDGSVGKVLSLDVDGECINDLVFNYLGPDNPDTGSPSWIGIGCLEFPTTSLLSQPYLYGYPKAGPDLRIDFIHGVTNSLS